MFEIKYPKNTFSIENYIHCSKKFIVTFLPTYLSVGLEIAPPLNPNKVFECYRTKFPNFFMIIASVFDEVL